MPKSSPQEPQSQRASQVSHDSHVQGNESSRQARCGTRAQLQDHKTGFPVLSDILCLLETKKLLKSSSLSPKEARSLQVCGASADSRNVAPGNIFICKGAAFDPAYVVQALERGAVAIVCSPQWESAVQEVLKKTQPQDQAPLLVVDDMRVAMAEISALAWGYPNQDLCIIGVTGTKGKSTTTSMVKALLDEITEDAAQTAYLGTHHIYNGKETLETPNTTPEPPDLWRTLYEAASNGCTYVVMEVSSQALKYGRTRGLAFDVACFLNIGTDHISEVEHPTFEDYFQSKLRIFDQGRQIVLNIDTAHLAEIEEYLQEHFAAQDPMSFSGLSLLGCEHDEAADGAANEAADKTADEAANEAANEAADETAKAPEPLPPNNLCATGNLASRSKSSALSLPIATFSLANQEADYYTSHVSVINDCRQSMRFTLHAPTFAQELTLGMSGEHNVLDAIAALAIVGRLNLTDDQLKEAAKVVLPHMSIPGRMEIVSSSDKRIIGVVDYAHNDISFETVFRTLKKNYPHAYVIALFGVSGGKALNRYQDLPRVASEHADFLFLTSDEPGPVDPHVLLDEMEKGVKAGVSFAKEVDREKAVDQAYAKAQEVLKAGEADQVLICALAKGDETTMEIGGKTISIEPDLAHLKRLLTQN